jgi:hypothetical protein
MRHITEFVIMDDVIVALDVEEYPTLVVRDAIRSTRCPIACSRLTGTIDESMLSGFLE